MPDYAIEVIDLTKKYGDIVALKGISFTVYQGETFSLIGPNGSGKTTTVEILECIRTPTSGEARVLGFDVLKEDKEIKKRIGVLPQEFEAFDRLTVEENIRVIEKIYGVKADIRSLLEEFGLWELRKRKYGTLSGGQKRKVGICMAIVNDPEIVFLDEPTTGLDPKAREECWNALERLNKMGKTVFLTSHYMEEVERLSDRVAIIVKGKILDVGNVKELISKYGGGIKVIVKGNVDFEADKIYKSGKETIGVFKSREKALKIITELFEKGYEFEIKEPSLEDVFLHIAKGRISEEGELI
ncbi:MAG TPA: ABC transporter ATP-binding protein [Archaeoglobus profundus]|nr:ABC transporter ATP-binding protein [Archaeoglobus profundus]